MAELPRHPEANDDIGSAAGRQPSIKRPALVFTAVVVVALLVVLTIVLHVTGVVGAGAH